MLSKVGVRGRKLWQLPIKYLIALTVPRTLLRRCRGKSGRKPRRRERKVTSSGAAEAADACSEASTELSSIGKVSRVNMPEAQREVCMLFVGKYITSQQCPATWLLVTTCTAAALPVSAFGRWKQCTQTSRNQTNSLNQNISGGGPVFAFRRIDFGGWLFLAQKLKSLRKINFQPSVSKGGLP